MYASQLGIVELLPDLSGTWGNPVPGFWKALLGTDTNSGEIPAGAHFGRPLIRELRFSVWKAGLSAWMRLGLRLCWQRQAVCSSVQLRVKIAPVNIRCCFASEALPWSSLLFTCIGEFIRGPSCSQMKFMWISCSLLTAFHSCFSSFHILLLGHLLPMLSGASGHSFPFNSLLFSPPGPKSLFIVWCWLYFIKKYSTQCPPF